MYANGSWVGMAKLGHEWGEVLAEVGACNLVAQSANRCHYKRKPQAKQANAEGEAKAKANTACEEGLGVWISVSVSG